jgi:hypothetical protein
MSGVLGELAVLERLGKEVASIAKLFWFNDKGFRDDRGMNIT